MLSVLQLQIPIQHPHPPVVSILSFPLFQILHHPQLRRLLLLDGRPPSSSRSLAPVCALPSRVSQRTAHDRHHFSSLFKRRSAGPPPASKPTTSQSHRERARNGAHLKQTHSYCRTEFRCPQRLPPSLPLPPSLSLSPFFPSLSPALFPSPSFRSMIQGLKWSSRPSSAICRAIISSSYFYKNVRPTHGSRP